MSDSPVTISVPWVSDTERVELHSSEAGLNVDAVEKYARIAIQILEALLLALRAAKTVL